MVDDFCQAEGYLEPSHRGPRASLSCREVVTLALFGQWSQFPRERAFYRSGLRRLRTAFPTLPDRGQFNGLQCPYTDAIGAFSLFLVRHLHAQECLYELLDSCGIPTRDAKRRGAAWLPGQAAIGWSNRIG